MIRTQTNCYAFVIRAYNKETHLPEGFYVFSNRSLHPATTASIWNATFMQSIKTVKNMHAMCRELAPEYDWRIQKVSMNAPQDVDF